MHILKRTAFPKIPSEVVRRLTWNTITIHCSLLIRNLNPGKDLIFKDLLFEQFFPTKPGTQVQL